MDISALVNPAPEPANSRPPADRAPPSRLLNLKRPPEHQEHLEQPKRTKTIHAHFLPKDERKGGPGDGKYWATPLRLHPVNGKPVPPNNPEYGKQRKVREKPIWARRAEEAPLLSDNLPMEIGTLGGGKVYDQITHTLCDMLFEHVVQASNHVPDGVNLEVEARLGLMCEKGTDAMERIDLPVVTEAITHPGLQTQFKSSMSIDHHKKLNEYLSRIYREQNAKKPGSITYTHPKVRDLQHYIKFDSYSYRTLPTWVLEHFHGEDYPPHRKGKVPVRISRDEKTGQIVAKIIKIRRAHAEIYNPQLAFDIRVAINWEYDWQGHMEDLELEPKDHGNANGRRKDRISYSICQGLYTIDLTQVGELSDRSENRTHELEIEVDTGSLIRAGQEALRAQGKDDVKYPAIVKAWYDNVRLLAREVSAV